MRRRYSHDYFNRGTKSPFGFMGDVIVEAKRYFLSFFGKDSKTGQAVFYYKICFMY